MRYQNGTTLIEASTSIVATITLLLVLGDQVLSLHNTFKNQTIVAKAAYEASRRMSLYYAQDPSGASSPSEQDEYVYRHIRQSFGIKELQFNARFSEACTIPHTVAVTCTWHKTKRDGTEFAQSNCFVQRINP